MVTNTQGKGLIIKTWLKYFHEHGMTVKKLAKDKFQGFKKKKTTTKQQKTQTNIFQFGVFLLLLFFVWLVLF